jgi:HlyD family secretion protein
MPRPSRRKLLLAAVPVLAVVAVAIWYWWPERASEGAEIAGLVRTTEIRIAPEISGRMARFLVEPGQTVQRGQPVALLSNPELWAAVGAARAEVDKARSDRDRVYAGVREEQVQGLQREIDKAQAVHAQAEQELARKSALAARSDASAQDLDKARAAEARGLADIAVAEARFAEAQRGPTAEERALADATVAAAEAARDVVEARAAKMLLRAPASGVIAILVAELGEAVVPGAPVLTMIPDHGIWFGFNLREDALRGVMIGASVPVRSSSAEPVTGKVSEMRNWGEFAAWRAARATGDHDLNTFFIRLDSVVPTPDLAPGQTVWLKPASMQSAQQKGRVIATDVRTQSGMSEEHIAKHRHSGGPGDRSSSFSAASDRERLCSVAIPPPCRNAGAVSHGIVSLVFRFPDRRSGCW